MAEDNAEDGVPAAVRQILQERARQGVAPPATAAPVAPVAAAEPEAVGTAEQLSLAEVREAFQRSYFQLLMEPEVLDALRRHLRSRDKKVMRDLLGVILPALFPHEKATGGGPSRITLISRIERPDVHTTATTIETPR